MADPKKAYEEPSVIAMLGLEALARYVQNGIAHKGERMHEDLAKRLVRAIDKGTWS